MFRAWSSTLPWCSSHARHHSRSSAEHLGIPRSSESSDPWTRSLSNPWFPPAQTLSVGPGSYWVPLQQEVRGGGPNESLQRFSTPQSSVGVTSSYFYSIGRFYYWDTCFSWNAPKRFSMWDNIFFLFPLLLKGILTQGTIPRGDRGGLCPSYDLSFSVFLLKILLFREKDTLSIPVPKRIANCWLAFGFSSCKQTTTMEH